MDRTKRQENGIIIHFGFYFILLLGVVLYFIFSVYPKITEIEKNKEITKEVYQNFNRVKKEGLNLKELKSIINDSLSNSSTKDLEGNDVYLKEILKDLDLQFYTDVFKNSTEDTYEEFIDSLILSYRDRENFEENTELIQKILPVYSEHTDDKEFNNLTDYKFINYIEAIGETFNVSFNNSIGIKNVNILDGYSIGIGDSSLETNIYYIPLELDVSGTKKDILDFLYFIEKVGNIEIEEDKIVVNNDLGSDFFEFKKKVLKGESKIPDYNIFNNQIIDIQSINFDEYIDGEFDNVKEKTSLVSYIKRTQGNDSYNANISLRFYVKGIPVYKLEEYIKNFIKRFGEIKVELTKKLKDQNLNGIKREKLLDINKSLTQLGATVVKGMQKSIVTKTKIEEAYKQAFSFNDVFDDYLNEINK